MSLHEAGFSPEEIGLLQSPNRWRNDRFTRFLRWWLCRGVWNSEAPLYVDPRKIEDMARQFIIAQHIIDSWHPGSEGLIVRDIT